MLFLCQSVIEMINDQSEDRMVISRIDQPCPSMVNFVSEMNLTSYKDSFKLIYRRNRADRQIQLDQKGTQTI